MLRIKPSQILVNNLFPRINPSLHFRNHNTRLNRRKTILFSKLKVRIPQVKTIVGFLKNRLKKNGIKNRKLLKRMAVKNRKGVVRTPLIILG